ncbi:glycosyltransferase family 4 protein [Gorillibacterium massiliense]|uniref:glycosyltransferase family 4 protein n=1 Tax=Gorillibacterium massiliense TaxID=1280390 RepID=UPI0004B25BD3|nr:glycosyltransferase family 4 protein [Gorillibacterium massiliense]
METPNIHLTRKTHILFITHAVKKGGAEQSLIHLINYLDPSAFRISLLAPPDANFLQEIRADYEHFPLRLNSIKKKLGFGYLNTVMQIQRFVKEREVDIVHANGWRAPWYAAPLKFTAKCKLVWHHRDHTHLLMFNRVLPRFFHQVICISRFVADSLHTQNKTVIYNGIDPTLAPVKTRRFKEDGTLVVGTFGRIVEWKRYDLVIEAVKRLADVGKTRWRLLIVGDASVDGSDRYYDDMIAKVKEYGLERNVIFYGYSPKPLEVMGECDVTVNFSRNEPFGRVIIESLLAGTPVIVSDSGGAPEIIQQAGGGFIVKDGDVKELSRVLAGFYDRQVEYDRLAQEGFHHVMTDFNMSAIARKVEELYRQLLAEPVQAKAVGELSR